LVSRPFITAATFWGNNLRMFYIVKAVLLINLISRTLIELIIHKNKCMSKKKLISILIYLKSYKTLYKITIVIRFTLGIIFSLLCLKISFIYNIVVIPIDKYCKFIVIIWCLIIRVTFKIFNIIFSNFLLLE